MKKKLKKDKKDVKDYKTVFVTENGEQKMFMILYYKSEIYWLGYDIKKSKLNEGSISTINDCTLNIDYKGISYFDETGLFISSFIYSCKINGKYNLYNFIYSFDNNKNFEYTFLGAIRNFTIGDSCENCVPFKFRYNTKIAHSFIFSPIFQKYGIITNILDSNKNTGVSLFLLNKNINTNINSNNNFNYSSNLICEDFSNFNNSNCLSNSLINEIFNTKIKFIQTCKYEYDISQLTCNFNNSSNNDSDLINEDDDDNND